jgi:serine/threonine protein kinase
MLWKSLNHPNILGLIGVCRWDNRLDAKFTMVYEWMTNGNITEYIKNNESYRMQLVCDSSSRRRAGTDESHSSRTVLRGYNIFIT